MRRTLNILFYENGDPMEYRCIERSLRAFPKGYWKVVRKVIERTRDGLDEEIFRLNVAELLRSFKMTRAGAFQGLSVNRMSKTGDKEARAAVDSCWKSVEKELLPLKEYIGRNILTKSSRVLVELSSESEKHILETTSRLFQQLSGITVRNKGGGNSWVGNVAASKILFSVLPEIALPVDTNQWKHVFCTKDYSEVLMGMLTEIKEWEKASKRKLDERDRDSMTTLPAIYNVLAMAARPIQ